MSRWIVLDTETTGLDPRQGHRVVEIGLVEMVNRRRARTWHHYLNPKRDSDPGALEKHGLTTAFLSDKPEFEDLVDSMMTFLTEPGLDQLIIHNAPFDLAFLDHELACLGRKPLLDHFSEGVLIDTLMLARERFPGKRNSLDALCERLFVDNRERTFHGALLDAQLLSEVYLALTRGQEELDMFAGAAVSSSSGLISSPVLMRHQDRLLRVVSPSPEEQRRHEEQLADIDKISGGKTLWRVALARG